MRRPPAALWIWYRGGAFLGFQRQAEEPTVQQVLEQALQRAGVPSTVMPAGRTDRGVHARMQVVSVRLQPGDSPEALAERLPPLLPAELGLCVARRPHPSFHAQWSATGKEYRYRVQLGGTLAEAWRPYVLEPSTEPRLAGAPASPERVAELLTLAAGTRDFSAFHTNSSPRKPRTLESATLHELGGGLFEARLRGDSFGRYQVRFLLGAVLLVATGALPEELYRAALEQAVPMEGHKAPAQGLVLWEVRYPPGLDPFSAEERERAPALPHSPPFADPLEPRG